MNKTDKLENRICDLEFVLKNIREEAGKKSDCLLVAQSRLRLCYAYADTALNGKTLEEDV